MGYKIRRWKRLYLDWIGLDWIGRNGGAGGMLALVGEVSLGGGSMDGEGGREGEGER